MAVVAALTGGVVACGDGSTESTWLPSAGSESHSDEVASVSLALEIGSTVEIDTVSYDITGGGFHRAGSIDVSHSSTAAAIIDGVPFGTGYVATMTASGTGPAHVDCAGTASFDVSVAGVTAVPVHLTCKEPPTPPPPPPPSSVPVPGSAVGALSLLLLGAGISLLGRGTSLARERRSGLG